MLRLLGFLQARRVHKGFGGKEQQLLPLWVKGTINQYPGSAQATTWFSLYVNGCLFSKLQLIC